MMKVLLPVLGLGLSTSLAAQAPVTYTPGTHLPGVHFYEKGTVNSSDPTAWNVTTANLPVERFLTGQFSSVHDRDVVVLRGGEVFFFRAVARRDAQQLVHSSATGIAILEDGNGDLDALLVADSSGLTKYDWDDSTGMTEDTSFSAPTTTDWQGIKELRTVDGKLYALTGSGDTLLEGTVASGGGSLSQTGTTDLSAHPGLEIEPMRWGSSQILGIAVLAADDIAVYDPSSPPPTPPAAPTPLWHYAHAFPTSQIAVSRSTISGEKDFLMWALTIGADGYLAAINVDKLTGSVPNCFQVFEDKTASSLACFDWDTEQYDSDPDEYVTDYTHDSLGRDDVVLGRTGMTQVLLMRRQPPTTAGFPFQILYGPSWVFRLPDCPDAGTNTQPYEARTIGHGDLDGDGDEEVLFSMPQSDMISMQLSEEEDQYSNAPWFSDGSSFDADSIAFYYEGDHPNANATHFEIEAWRSYRDDSPAERLEIDTTISNALQPIPSTAGPVEWAFDDSGLSPASDDETVYQYFVREVQVDPLTSEVVWKGTGITFVVVLDEDENQTSTTEAAVEAWINVSQVLGTTESPTGRHTPPGPTNDFLHLTLLKYLPANTGISDPGNLAGGVYVSTRPRRVTIYF